MTYFGRLSYRQGTLKIKILSFLGLGLVLVATRYMFLSSDGDASFHLHHTTSALVVMCLCKFQNTTSLIIASIFMGVIVDGIVKWSEWNYFDTWTTSQSYTQYVDNGPEIPNVLNWTSPELQLYVSGVSSTSVDIENLRKCNGTFTRCSSHGNCDFDEFRTDSPIDLRTRKGHRLLCLVETRVQSQKEIFFQTGLFVLVACVVERVLRVQSGICLVGNVVIRFDLI